MKYILHRATVRRPVSPSRRGFTLVEALLAVATLALMAAAISGLYVSGVRSLDVQTRDMLLQSQLRSQMEQLVGTPFGVLQDGSSVFGIVKAGQTNSYTLTWSVTPVDLDGDAIPEPAAKQVTVSLAGHSLTMLIVDNKGRVGKL